MRSTRARFVGTAPLAMLALCLAAASAAAQDMIPPTPSPATEIARRPYRGLFASEGRPDVTTLDLLFSAFTAYDEDVFAAEEGGSIAPQARESGWFSGVSGGFTFHRPGDKVVMGALGGVSVNRYEAPERDGRDHQGFRRHRREFHLQKPRPAGVDAQLLAGLPGILLLERRSDCQRSRGHAASGLLSQRPSLHACRWQRRLHPRLFVAHRLHRRCVGQRDRIPRSARTT